MSLAEKLITLRKQKGMTQMEQAEILSVSRQAISRWKVGAAVPSTDNLKILGELYETPIDYLLNDEKDVRLNYWIVCFCAIFILRRYITSSKITKIAEAQKMSPMLLH